MPEIENDLDDIERKFGHLIVVGACVALILLVVVAAIASHWFALRLQSDFWPLDKSTVAPNILASIIQAVLVVAGMAIFYPPLRKALDRAAAKHKNEIKAHISAELGAVHAKIDRIHQHLNISEDHDS